MPANTLTDTGLLRIERAGMTVSNDGLFWPYVGSMGYDTDLISDLSHDLLWDWANALGTNIF